MTGADSVNVMEQGQPLTGLNKSVSDLISPETSIAWSGTTGAVKGTLNHIQDWQEFSSVLEEQEGHYFPVKLDNKYLGQSISVQRTGGVEKTCTAEDTDDLEWVMRIPEQNAVYTFKANGGEIFTLNFATATLAEE